jgi:AcrR family transcriptional regulator
MSVTRMDAASRKDVITACALVAFARNGYHETSMADIAGAAGVTKPVLYQHFESKRDLYLHLLTAVGRDLVATVTAAASAVDGGREQTEHGMVGYFRWVLDNADAFVLLFGGAARVDDEFAESVRLVESQMADAIAPLIAADLSATDQRTMAFGLVGMAEAVSRHLMATGEPFSPEDLGRQVASLAWAGLRGLGQARNTQPL